MNHSISNSLTHFDGPNQIFIGNGEGLSISSVGSSSFVSPNDSHITFKLDKHVPSISKNLLSVSQYAKDNSIFFEFHHHLCLVKSQETNKVLQGVVGADGLYSFHNIKLQDNSPQLLSTSTLLQTIACLIQLLLLIDHMLPSHSSTSVYSPLELIFIDLWGPYHLTSYFGFKYCVSFIDAFSRYTWIFPIKTKAKTIFIFQVFKSIVELQLNTKIKSVQSDWGGLLS